MLQPRQRVQADTAGGYCMRVLQEGSAGEYWRAAQGTLACQSNAGDAAAGPCQQPVHTCAEAHVRTQRQQVPPEGLHDAHQAVGADVRLAGAQDALGAGVGQGRGAQRGGRGGGIWAGIGQRAGPGAPPTAPHLWRAKGMERLQHCTHGVTVPADPCRQLAC